MDLGSSVAPGTIQSSPASSLEIDEARFGYRLVFMGSLWSLGVGARARVRQG